MTFRCFKFFLLIVFLTIIASLSGCSDNNSKNSLSGAAAGNETSKKVKTVPVEVISPKKGTAASHYVTTSTLTPSSDARINSRTAGVVRKILHEEGDDVKAGQVLLLLEDDDQRLRLKQAKIKLSSAETEYNRLNKMQKAGVVSQNDWDLTRNNYLNAKAELELAELVLSYTRIAAPFDGRVVWRGVDLGAYVSKGDLLFRMMSIHPLLIRVYVPAARTAKLRAGQKVALNVETVEAPLQGIIKLVSPIVDPSTGSVKVTIRLDQYPVAVRPGDFVEINMVTDRRENALLLPGVAILEERGQHFVFTVQSNQAIRRNVNPGYVVGEWTEVISGLKAEDIVVSKGQRYLNDGNHLKVINRSEMNSDLQPGVESKLANNKDKKRSERVKP